MQKNSNEKNFFILISKKKNLLLKKEQPKIKGKTCLINTHRTFCNYRIVCSFSWVPFFKNNPKKSTRETLDPYTVRYKCNIMFG
jgi:hypothetical protein